MKQKWVPYTEWEDYKFGMWGKSNDEDNDLKKAIEFTSDYLRYGHAMGKVSIAWPMTMINSLSNKSINRKAFLGHCAVCFELGIPEYITRKAWGFLTEQQRYDADKIATHHIKVWEYEYERKNRKIHNGLGTQMLFEWATG